MKTNQIKCYTCITTHALYHHRHGSPLWSKDNVSGNSGVAAVQTSMCRHGCIPGRQQFSAARFSLLHFLFCHLTSGWSMRFFSKRFTCRKVTLRQGSLFAERPSQSVIGLLIGMLQARIDCLMTSLYHFVFYPCHLVPLNSLAGAEKLFWKSHVFYS